MLMTMLKVTQSWTNAPNLPRPRQNVFNQPQSATSASTVIPVFLFQVSCIMTLRNLNHATLKLFKTSVRIKTQHWQMSWLSNIGRWLAVKSQNDCWYSLLNCSRRVCLLDYQNNTSPKSSPGDNQLVDLTENIETLSSQSQSSLKLSSQSWRSCSKQYLNMKTC